MLQFGVFCCFRLTLSWFLFVLHFLEQFFLLGVFRFHVSVPDDVPSSVYPSVCECIRVFSDCVFFRLNRFAPKGFALTITRPTEAGFLSMQQIRLDIATSSSTNY